MSVRRYLLASFVLTALALLPTPAYAYQNEVPSDWTYTVAGATWTQADAIPCFICHGSGTDALNPPTESSGPHGGYITSTNKCAACHAVHTAVGGGILLLPAATVTATCEHCHDGTGGTGVYGALSAAGVPVRSAHRIDLTSVVPGGDGATGGDDTRVFAGAGGTLACSDCHSPHGTNVVDPFTRERARTTSAMTDATTSRLLKRQVNSSTTATSVYGSDWCGECHTGRLSGSGAFGNHPVESAVNPPEAGGAAGTFDYEHVVKVSGANALTTSGPATLAGDNFGFVMPDPRTTGASGQTGHTPICQQCHEDGRSVGDNPAYPQQVDNIGSPSELFRVTTPDGSTATDNPRFQAFPHESPNLALLIETDDDLCLNCHGQLP